MQMVAFLSWIWYLILDCGGLYYYSLDMCLLQFRRKLTDAIKSINGAILRQEPCDAVNLR